ncbi:MAG: SLC13 family permease [Muribaculaceae bacterium]|nr:SLC13 family permease [Muribaculaceae bacterium]
MLITIVTLVLAAAGFVWGKIRADIVALIALLVLTLSGILTTQEALSGFSNPIVIMMVGLFVVGGAIFNTGLAKMIGAKLSRLGNGSATRLFLVVVLATGLIGGFVSNTGTVALMLPIVVSMAASAGASASRFLMPLAFASSIGGMLTLIGTPPNLVIAEAWEEFSGKPLTMFSFLPTGLICLAAGTLLLIPLSRILSGNKKKNNGSSKRNRTLADIVEEYNLNHDLWRVDVPASSPISGLSLGALSLRANYGLEVLELRVEGKGLLKNVSQEAPTASSVIEVGDILFIRGPRGNVDRFVSDYGLRVADDNDESRRHLDFYDIGLAEIVILPNSGILKETIAGLDFRNRYNVNILGVRRGGEYITDNLGERKVAKGDVLLVQGTWDAIEKISRDTHDWVVLGEPVGRASKVTIDYKAPVAAVIMLAMIAALVFSSVPAVFIVLTAGVLMMLTGCFRSVADAYRTINWESIVLIAAMMPMSFALEKTGVSETVSVSLVEALGQIGPHWLMAGIYFTTSLLTLFISNTATSVLMAPIAVQSAVAYGVSPLPMLFAVTFGASLCFMSPFSTPPNALVMAAGQYTFMDYVKVGAPLQILLGILMIFVIPVFFPF